MNNNRADAIKIAAVVTAVPRWAGALMAADGVPVPAGWVEWWQIAAFVMSIAMAAVEGFAISFVFNSWRNQQDKKSRLLLWLAIIMLVDFAVILTPYVVSNVSEEELASVLGTGALLWLWSIAVAASTGLVVGSVGYAQKESKSQPASSQQGSGTKPAKARYICESCELVFATQSALNAHSPARCAEKLHKNGKEPAPEPETEQAK